MTKNQPVHEIRFGVIKAAIWENKAGDNTIHNVTFSRGYKDGDQWKNSDSFGRDDLLPLAKAADQAHSWIFENRARTGGQQPPQQQPTQQQPTPQQSARPAPSGIRNSR